MAASKFAVVYSKSTGRVRSWVNFNGQSETDELLTTVKTQQGEAVIFFPMSQYGDINTIQGLVNQQTGLNPSNDRYAIVDTSQNDGLGNNLIIGVVIADPAGCGDNIPNALLVAHATAMPGWKYSIQSKAIITPQIVAIAPLSIAQQAVADAGKIAGRSAAQIIAAIQALSLSVGA